MEQRGMVADLSPGIDVLVAATHKSQLKEALTLATELRQSGLRVELVPKADKPGRIRKTASERGIAFAVLVFDGEV
ncbi:unnamed protein product, partial [Laminaria digitata]